MRASKEIRSWINRLRSKHARKNGVIPVAHFDNPKMEAKENSNKRLSKNTEGDA